MNVKQEIGSRLREWSIINKTEIKWKLLRSQSNFYNKDVLQKQHPNLILGFCYKNYGFYK